MSALRVLARASATGQVFNCIPLARADSSGAVYVAWDESKHPRHPRGTEDGGEFAPSEGGAEAKTDTNGFGVFEPDNTYAGVSDNEWDDWTQYSSEVNAALEGTLKVGQVSSLGETITESDVAEFKIIGQKIQRAAESNHLVGNFALFRGEAYDTVEAARGVYKHNALIKFDRLTSTTNDLSAATEYASGQGGNDGRVKVLLAFQQRGGIQGIQTAPLGVPSNEVVLPKGAQFRVVGVRAAGKNSIVVELYNKAEPKGKRVVDQFGKRESYGGLQGLIAHASTQVDFAQANDYSEVATRLDELEAEGVASVRAVLLEVRASLESQVRGAKDAAGLRALVADLKPRRRSALRDAVLELMRRAWDAGSGDAWGEVTQVREHAEEGVWRTIRGRRIFIREGEELESALKRSLGSDFRKDAGRRSTLKGIEKELSVVRSSMHDEGKDLFESAHLVGSFGKNDLERMPDRRGKGTSDIDVILTAKTVTGNWKVRAEARDARSVFVDKLQKKLRAFSPREIEVRESDVIAGAGALKIYAALNAKLEQRDFAIRSRIKSSFIPRPALQWLRQKAFYISDILGDKILTEAKGVILNSIKTGRTTQDALIDLAVVLLPYLGDPAVVQDDEQLTPHRLETIVRTNTTEAYNHGRLTTFVDPDVLPFVDWVRYSAILDTRTTEVCRFLHMKLFKPGASALEELLPPNHFNCRSIVSAVVVGETVDMKDVITVAQIGKAKSLADAKFLTERGAWKNYAASWDEAEHPRHPSGDDRGGEFAPKDGEFSAKQVYFNSIAHLMSDDEREMLAHYSYLGSEYINDNLRAGISDAQTERAVSVIDRAFEKAPRLSSDIVVFRSVKNSSFVPGNQAGYLSVSWNQASVARDIKKVTEHYSILKIIVPAGTPVISMRGLSEAPGGGKKTEGELLLPRGLRLSEPVGGVAKIYSDLFVAEEPEQ